MKYLSTQHEVLYSSQKRAYREVGSLSQSGLVGHQRAAANTGGLQ